MPSHSEFLNWLIVMLGSMAVWYQWKAYRILRSPAFIILTIALVYLTIYRAALPYYPFITGYGIAVPFYLLMVIHGILMNRSLQRVLAASMDEDTLEQESPWLWKPQLDYITLAVVVVAIIGTVLLEVWELFFR